jgi:predicted amidohydrolase
VARYDKIHLFGFARGRRAYDEAATIERGDQVVAFDSPLGRVGIAICYDLRFPELFRALGECRLAGAARRLHRNHRPRPLGNAAARPRRREPVLRPGRGAGRPHPNGRMTHGNSMVIDPWGEVLARMDKGEGVVLAELDPQRLVEHQKQPARPETPHTVGLTRIRA